MRSSMATRKRAERRWWPAVVVIGALIAAPVWANESGSTYDPQEDDAASEDSAVLDRAVDPSNEQMDPVPSPEEDKAPSHREAQQEQPLPMQAQDDPRLEEPTASAGEAPTSVPEEG